MCLSASLKIVNVISSLWWCWVIWSTTMPVYQPLHTLRTLAQDSKLMILNGSQWRVQRIEMEADVWDPEGLLRVIAKALKRGCYYYYALLNIRSAILSLRLWLTDRSELNSISLWRSWVTLSTTMSVYQPLHTLRALAQDSKLVQWIEVNGGYKEKRWMLTFEILRDW